MSFRIVSHLYKACLPLARGPATRLHPFTNSFAQCVRYRSDFVVRAFGVPWASTRKDLKDFFQGCNVVGEEKGVHMTYNEKGLRSPICYVEMESYEDLEKALERNNEYMGERYIQLSPAGRNELDSNADIVSSKTGHMIKMWGIPFEATVDDVNYFLSPLVPASVTLRRGHCFVDLDTDEDVEAALLKHKEYMGQRFVNVYKAD